MVERAGADACRPDDLDPQYGLRDGKYFLSPEQAQAILELRLHRLTGLEHEKLLAEYQEILTQIGELIRILTSATRLMEVIREELEAVKAEFGDARPTPSPPQPPRPPAPRYSSTPVGCPPGRFNPRKRGGGPPPPRGVGKGARPGGLGKISVRR